MIELKPCPFCGSGNVLGGKSDDDGNGFAVWCAGCGVMTNIYATPDEAETVWNTRAPAAPGMVWQPIETAPKTGQTILLGYKNSFGKWRTMRGQWFSQAQIDDEWDEPEGYIDGWYETSVEADDPPNCWPTLPTHWMPLPAAPDAGRE